MLYRAAQVPAETAPETAEGLFVAAQVRSQARQAQCDRSQNATRICLRHIYVSVALLLAGIRGYHTALVVGSKHAAQSESNHKTQNLRDRRRRFKTAYSCWLPLNKPRHRLMGCGEQAGPNTDVDCAYLPDPYPDDGISTRDDINYSPHVLSFSSGH